MALAIHKTAETPQSMLQKRKQRTENKLVAAVYREINTILVHTTPRVAPSALQAKANMARTLAVALGKRKTKCYPAWVA